MKTVTITQVKSTIGILDRHRKTMHALGLKKINRSVTHQLTPSIKGMIDQIQYLVKVT